ncbi:MAG: hypothetical protein JXX29_03420 [Deltaproteobacteria bacterium]|nr:hypothetical protein [Deltaproteobacteria bacterium]MBN2670692.1 hypothetical protein [Deltaproteobacteria bacterium]
MNKSIFTRLGLITAWMMGLNLLAGCEDNHTYPPVEPPTNQVNAESSPEIPVITELDSDTSQWITITDGAKMIALDEECCETTGHVNECWEKDAIEDDAVGNILCSVNGDCAAGQTCNSNINLTAYPNITAAGFTGLCTCDTHADCRDTSGDGGACFETIDPVTSATVNLCGPSMCNGYYVCSCWGGCVWWDGNSTANTPSLDAAALGLYCCENEDFANPDVTSGLITFGDSSCSGTVTTVDACTSDTDCVDTEFGDDQCVIHACDTDNGLCTHTITTSLECDADSLGCTLDRCGTDGLCAYSGTRCGADATYIDGSGTEQTNTCVETCREDATDTDSDGNTWACNINLTEPSDASQDPSGICEWWTCESAGTFNEPVFHETDCSALSAASMCYDYECDTSGTQGNCDSFVAVTATNDDCNNAVSLGGFALSDASGPSTRLETYGDTRCATNTHYASALNCYAGANSPSPLGYGGWDATGASGGKDLVYTFTYEASSSATSAYRYNVQLETLWNNSDEFYDGAVYLSTSLASNGGCDTTDAGGAPYAVEAENCDRLFNGKIQEDHCYTFTGTGYDSGDTFYECVSLEGSPEYEWAEGTGNAYYAKASIDEEPSYSGTVTVYVYVDADDGAAGGGEFFLSVTKEAISDCPLPGTADFFYKGPVYRVMDEGTYDFAVPINGSDFDPVDAADQIQTGTLGTVAGVVVSGNTYTGIGYTGAPSPGNYYDPDGTDPDYDSDDPYAWDSYDEAWELDIQTDGVRFAASLCDYGGSYNSTPGMAGNVYNPMIGIFNCHGERIDFNDDSWECGTQGSQIRPTSAVDAANGPYYIIVDGKYEPPGSSSGGTGNPVGNNYDLSIFYDPVVGDSTCDPTGADAGTGFTLGFPVFGTEPATSGSVDYTSGCIFIETDESTPYECDGITFYSNNTGPGPSQECRTGGAYEFCSAPFIIEVTLWFSDTAATKTCAYTDWLATYDDHFNDIGANGYIELYDVHPEDPDCDVFDGVAINFSYPPQLSAAELLTCQTYCKYAEWIKVVDSNPCDFK